MQKKIEKNLENCFCFFQIFLTAAKKVEKYVTFGLPWATLGHHG